MRNFVATTAQCFGTSCKLQFGGSCCIDGVSLTSTKVDKHEGLFLVYKCYRSFVLFLVYKCYRVSYQRNSYLHTPAPQITGKGRLHPKDIFIAPRVHNFGRCTPCTRPKVTVHPEVLPQICHPFQTGIRLPCSLVK